MQNRSMWTELALGALGTALLVAFAMLVLAGAPLTAKAADAPTQGACHTPTEVRLTYEAHIPGLTTSVYRGDLAAIFLRMMIAAVGPPPEAVKIPERTVAVGTYIAGGHAEIVFFEEIAGMECRFFGTGGDSIDLETVFKALGATGRIGA